MNKIGILAILGAATGLSACGADYYTDSRFASVSPTGVFSQDLGNEQSQVTQILGTGFAYHTGVLPDGNGFLGEAGILPTSDVGADVVGGTANYTGIYDVGVIDDIKLSGNLLSGRQTMDSGAISLTADLGTGTLTGTSNNLALVVNGTISGGNIGGTVSYIGQNGSLDGIFGTDAAVGVFHGNNSERIFAGGFLGFDD